MLGDNIRRERKKKKLSINNLSKLSGISLGYLSDLENNKFTNPTLDKLKQIAGVLEVSIDEFFKDDVENKSIEKTLPIVPEKFTSPEEAVKFLLEQNVIMGFGGFDVDKLSDEEVVEFANSLLEHLKLLSLKYRK